MPLLPKAARLFLLRLPIELDGATQPLLQVDCRLKTQLSSGQADIWYSQIDICMLERFELDCRSRLCDSKNDVRKSQEGASSSWITYVACLSDRLGVRRRKNRPPYRVVDVGPRTDL